MCPVTKGSISLCSNSVRRSCNKKQLAVTFSRHVTVIQSSSPLVLTDAERQATWWTNEETDCMKENAHREKICMKLQAQAFDFKNTEHCELRSSNFVGNLELLLSKSTLDESDTEVILSTILSRDASKLIESDDTAAAAASLLLLLRGTTTVAIQRTKRSNNGVRRVIRVQCYLNQQKVSASRKADLIRVASLYHSGSPVGFAALVGEVSALAAFHVYNN